MMHMIVCQLEYKIAQVRLYLYVPREVKSKGNV